MNKVPMLESQYVKSVCQGPVQNHILTNLILKIKNSRNLKFVLFTAASLVSKIATSIY